MTEKRTYLRKMCRFGGSKMTPRHIGNLKMTLAFMTEKEQSADLVGQKLQYRKSEIVVFFKKLRSESPQMLKSQKLHVSVYLRSNIPQTAFVAALDT
jgi:hypothetical protein